MKKILLTVVMAVAVIAATAPSYADIYNKTVDASIAANAWMNVGVTGPTDWGQGWGVADVRSTMLDSQTIFLQSNVNGSDDNPTDPYWAPGNLVMEGNTYGETAVLLGDTVNFDFHVVANQLASQGYTTEAFIKVLDPNAGWATVQNQRYDLATLGDGNISLDVGQAGVAQVGFAITGANDITGSGTAGLGVTVIPEPSTIGLVAVFGGGLLMFRRKLRR